MLNGLTIFFSITTVAVIAWPLVKLLPSWRERARYRKAPPPVPAVAPTEGETDIDTAA